VGTSDEEICKAVNLVIEHKGGMVAVDGNNHIVLPLPVAGLMSNLDGYEVANRYSKLIEFAHNLGSKMNAPFMTLSFMALLVIPKIKLSDKGLFDGEKFEFIDLHINN
jgi:adenine deaminase